MKSCKLCAQHILNKGQCKKNKVCEKYIHKRNSCNSCIYLKDCITLGKPVSGNLICINFKKEINQTQLQSQPKKEESKLIYSEVKKPDNFNPSNLVEKVIKSNYNPQAFEQIDDSEIPRAYNPIQFILDDNFLSIPLFPMQLKMAIEFFSAACPYCSNTKYIEHIEVNTSIDNILDNCELYHDGVCEKCGRSRYDAYRDKKLNIYNQFVAILGQRSGKSVFSIIVSAVITYKFLMLPNPVEYYGLLFSTILHGTFVGLRYSDAYDNLWAPYHKIITQAPWFKNYHKFLDKTGNEIGEELYKLRDTFVAYHHKNLGIYPAGPDKRKLRGKTRFLSAIDEISWFTGQKGNIKYDPDEIYTALDNSLMTILPAAYERFSTNPDIPLAYGLYISSPSSKTDKGMRLYKQSQGSKKIYGLHYPTWEINPKISRKALSEKYRQNPVEAERDFGANPPFSSDPYIKSPSEILDCFGKHRNLATITGYKTVKDSLDNVLLYPIVRFKTYHTYPSILSIDTGYNFNSFSCVLLHKGEDTIICSSIIEIIPNPHPISFIKVYEKVLSKIIELFNVKLVVTDRWESIDLRQRVYQDFGIDSFSYSVNMQDFKEVRIKLLSGDITFPRLETKLDDLIELEKPIPHLIDRKPVSHLFLQLLSSKDTGRIVTKGDEVTDDILRAFVLGYSVLTDPEYESYFDLVGMEINNIDISKIMNISLHSETAKNQSNIIPGIGISSSGRG